MTRYVFLDTETTGLNPHIDGHRIIELACIEYRDAKPTGHVFETKLNPEGKKSNVDAFLLHRISDEELLDKPTFKDIAEDFINFIQDSNLVIYNADFDVSFLNNELNRIGHISSVHNICNEVICAMKLAGEKFNSDKYLSLNNACKRYKIDISHRDNHGAHIDADLCAKLYYKLLDDSIIPLQRTPQSKPHREPKALTIPRAYRSNLITPQMQLNFCKNSECDNFGVVAMNPEKYANGKVKRGLRNQYKLTKKKKSRNEYLLTCKLCGQSSAIINNQSLGKEIERLSSIGIQDEPSCPSIGTNESPYGKRYYYIPESPDVRRGKAILKQACDNVGKGIFSYPELYTLSGKTRPSKTVTKKVSQSLEKGSKPTTLVYEEERLASQRVRCESCFTRFSVKLDPQQRHYMRDRNLPLFLNLMNKGIISREIEKLGISPKVLYSKIDFFYEQALAFDAYHSNLIDHAVATKTLNLSCDRLHHSSNWGDHNTPRPTPLMVTATVDNDSGYVFASSLNFDFQSDSQYVKKEYKEKKEADKESYYRRFAQYVLNEQDVQDLARETNSDIPMQIPTKGLLVNQTYSMLSHFFMVKQMLNTAWHINLYADNDSGFKTSIGAIFKDWLENGTMRAFQVNTERSGNNQLLDKATAEQIKEMDLELQIKFPDMSKDERLKRLWNHQFSSRVRLNGSKSEWIVSPNLRSRFAGFLPLYDIRNVSQDKVTSLLNSASLNGVDNWFQILRRHINYYERPVTSGTNSKRWNAYSGYNPMWMAKLMEVKRVYHNYCSTNERSLKEAFKGKLNSMPKPSSPAMRLHLADRLFSAEDILSFNYNLELFKEQNSDYLS
ncbi:exonuclease domain-containing protein [Candidatus Enterovibrio escicola]|uniref:exonuclease domain-containing protein n=1 Tax=Candidatus Enterovibrio escicola TaxID=1927127 RepID=UPI001237EC76|nr:exonuclease domain-containing protein [Candidatus Enterovibrio escacola]